MRSYPLIITLIFAFSCALAGQQIYESEGLDLFSKGEYARAAESLTRWAEENISEKGIACYFAGESYYNLGLGATSKSEAQRFYTQARNYFAQALAQPDLQSQFKDKRFDVLNKKAWTAFRLAELATDPTSDFRNAVRDFAEAQAAAHDSLQYRMIYMRAHCHFWHGIWYAEQARLSMNSGTIVKFNEDALSQYNEALSQLAELQSIESVPRTFKIVSGALEMDVRFYMAKVYQTMSKEAFAEINDTGKKESQRATYYALADPVNYSGLIENEALNVRERYEPSLLYSQAVALINRYMMTQRPEDENAFREIISQWNTASGEAEKFYLQAIAAHMKHNFKDSRDFKALTDSQNSLYVKAASLPESWYWLAWVQFIANKEESQAHFERFIRESENLKKLSRIDYLREDARYRILYLQFEQNMNSTAWLKTFKGRIEAFQPKYDRVQTQRNLLYLMVQASLNEWNTQDINQRFENVVRAIQTLLQGGSRVLGSDRLHYLNMLDRLFRITGSQHVNQTLFYQGMAEFLRAEIQNDDEDKLTYYEKAADILKTITPPENRNEIDYTKEAKYIRARSLLAMAKHAGNRQDDVRNDAKKLFVELINDHKSMRSLYYLAEILSYTNKGNAAKLCYQQVIDSIEDVEDRDNETDFWHQNARDGLANCKNTGDENVLNRIRYKQVTFNENLLKVRGKILSLERFADQDYIRRQYWDESVNLLKRFGLPKRTLYPSVFKSPHLNPLYRVYLNLNAGFVDQAGGLNSALSLRVLCPTGLPADFSVYLDSDLLTPNANGLFEKNGLPFNHTGEIQIVHEECYPYVYRVEFKKPETYHIQAILEKKRTFIRNGTGVDPTIPNLQFNSRDDRNLILYQKGERLKTGSDLYRKINQDIHIRDVCFYPVKKTFLVTDAEKRSLLEFDEKGAGEREFVLDLPDDVPPLANPEGIDVDDQGNIYIVDWALHRILKLNPNGSYRMAFGTLGTNSTVNYGQEVKLTYPRRIVVIHDEEGIPIDGEQVTRRPLLLVSDENGIHLLDTWGNYLATVIPREAGEFFGLAALGYDGTLRIFAHNRLTGDIERFIPAGE